VTARVSMRWFSGLAVLAFLLQSVQSGAGDRHQDTKSAPPPVHLTAEQDHQRICRNIAQVIRHWSIP
jgi:hypothetical protein